MLVPSLGMLVQIAFVVGGIYWCHEIFERLGRDIHELASNVDAVRKGVIVFIWGVTAFIIYLLARFAFAVFVAIRSSLATW